MSLDMQSIVTTQSRLINPLTMEYRLSLDDLKDRHRNVIWGNEITEATIAALGYAVVQPADKPQGDVVEETTPELIDEVFVQQWTSRAFTQEELEQQTQDKSHIDLSKVAMLTAGALTRGVPYNFGTEEDPKVQHIQIRDGDRANLAGMSVKSQRNPESPQAFRTLENETFTLSTQDVIKVTDAAYAGYLKILGVTWGIKDAIQTGQSPHIPETLEEFYTQALQWVWVNP